MAVFIALTTANECQEGSIVVYDGVDRGYVATVGCERLRGLLRDDDPASAARLANMIVVSLTEALGCARYRRAILAHFLPDLARDTRARDETATLRAFFRARFAKSRGHDDFIMDHEYFTRDGVVYRGGLWYPLGADGYRQGARFQCQEHMRGQCLKFAYAAQREYGLRAPGATGGASCA